MGKLKKGLTLAVDRDTDDPLRRPRPVSQEGYYYPEENNKHIGSPHLNSKRQPMRQYGSSGSLEVRHERNRQRKEQEFFSSSQSPPPDHISPETSQLPECPGSPYDISDYYRNTIRQSENIQQLVNSHSAQQSNGSTLSVPTSSPQPALSSSPRGHNSPSSYDDENNSFLPTSNPLTPQSPYPTNSPHSPPSMRPLSPLPRAPGPVQQPSNYTGQRSIQVPRSVQKPPPQRPIPTNAIPQRPPLQHTYDQSPPMQHMNSQRPPTQYSNGASLQMPPVPRPNNVSPQRPSTQYSNAVLPQRPPPIPHSNNVQRPPFHRPPVSPLKFPGQHSNNASPQGPLAQHSNSASPQMPRARSPVPHLSNASPQRLPMPHSSSASLQGYPAQHSNIASPQRSPIPHSNKASPQGPPVPHSSSASSPQKPPILPQLNSTSPQMPLHSISALPQENSNYPSSPQRSPQISPQLNSTSSQKSPTQHSNLTSSQRSVPNPNNMTSQRPPAQGPTGQQYNTDLQRPTLQYQSDSARQTTATNPSSGSLSKDSSHSQLLPQESSNDPPINPPRMQSKPHTTEQPSLDPCDTPLYVQSKSQPSSQSPQNRKQQGSSPSAAKKTETMDPPVTAEDYVMHAIKYHEENQLEKSTEYFRIAADQDNAIGIVLYGIALRHGWGCKKNPALAFKYLQKAAQSAIDGSNGINNTFSASPFKGELVLAIYELGMCFRHGWGVPKNKATAAWYFEMAAKMGDPDAQNDIGFCYYMGEGVKKDMKTAAKYYRMAHAQGQGTMGNSWIFKEKYND